MVEPLSRKRSSCLPRLIQSMFRQQRKSGNFLSWQYIYYFVLYLLSSLIFLISGLRSGNNVGYLNSVFLCISAGTGAGLNTVDLSTLNTFQQIILFSLIIMGSHTFVFAGLVITLRVKYKRRLNHEEKNKNEVIQDPASSPDADYDKNGLLYQCSGSSSTASFPGTGELNLKIASTQAPIPSSQSYRGKQDSEVLTCSENTKEEFRMRYHAFSVLSWIVPLYIVLIQLCGGIILGWFISVSLPSIPAENRINSWWSGIFISISAFNNSGMNLLDANMVPFQLSYFVLLVASALILLGNTLFPIILRITIQCLAKFLAGGDERQGWRDGLRLLVDKRSKILCPYLFTRNELFWLASTILILNGIDWAAFGISAAGNPALRNLPVIAQVVDGIFQAFAVRSGGFSVVNISSLRIGVQAIYVLMMYISSFPIDTSPHNVKEPDMSGTSGPLGGENVCEDGKTTAPSRNLKRPGLEFLKRQVNRTFTVDDFWLLAAFVWIIVVIESKHFEIDPASYSVFNIVFEVVSAYGCVGVSMGHPDYTTSLSGALRGGSQLLLCGVMLLGRTREARKGVMKGDWGIGAEFPGIKFHE